MSKIPFIEKVKDTFSNFFKKDKQNNTAENKLNNEKKDGFFGGLTIRNAGKPFWIGMLILLILLIFSIIILSVRLYSFTKLDDRAVSIKADSIEKLDVFSIEYQNNDGDIIIKGYDGDKVLAPGAKVEYTLRIRNVDKIALDYSLAPNVEFTSEYELPIKVRLIGPDEQYLVGDAKTWADIEELEKISIEETLVKGESSEYIFQWQWPFESGNDKYDTFLGANSEKHNIGLSIDFQLKSSANTSAKSNGGVFGEYTGMIILIMIILVLLIAAIIMFALSLLKKREPAPEPIIIEVPVEVPVPQPSIVEAPKKPEVFVPKPHIRKKTGRVCELNLFVFADAFRSGQVVTVADLKEKGFVPKNASRVKVLAIGEQELDKALYLEVHLVSKAAKAAIEKAGGSVREIND